MDEAEISAPEVVAAVDDGPTAVASAPLPGSRPDWLESTKHTRRRLPRRAPREERRTRNPWLVLGVVALVIVVVGGIAVVALQKWLDRSLVTVPDSLAGLQRSSDPDQLAIAQSIRDQMISDPKYSASRYEVAPYAGAGVVSYVVLVPAGNVIGEDDLASIAATTSEVEYGAPFTSGEAHCIAGAAGPSLVESYCYRTGPSYTVITITDGDDTAATTGARAAAEGYAAQA